MTSTADRNPKTDGGNTDTSGGSLPDEGASGQSARIRYWSIIIIVTGILFQVILESPPGLYGFVPRLREMFVDALVIAACVSLLSETPIFKSYVEARIKRSNFEVFSKIVTSIEKTFVATATNPDSLRQYTPETLGEIEKAAQLAALTTTMPEDVHDLLDALRKYRHQCEYWRDGCDYELRYEELSPESPTLFRLQIDSHVPYVNYTTKTQPVEQKLRFSTRLIDHNHPDVRTHFTLATLTLDGKDVLPNEPPSITTEGTKTVFTTEVRFNLPAAQPRAPGRVVLRRTSRQIESKVEPWVITFFRPVHKMTITARHPAHIMPTLFIFGVGGSNGQTDPIEPKLSDGEYHKWEFDGWCLPSHGMFVIWSDRRARVNTPINGTPAITR
jgi:hypothetical protein